MLSSGLASASQTGDHSEPGEAKIRSTPIPANTRKNASAPVSPLTSIMFVSSVARYMTLEYAAGAVNSCD